MIAGGLVARYGLRACPRGCAGRCQLADARSGGAIAASPDCELMRGEAPTPGSMPPLDRHTDEQLRAIADDRRSDEGNANRARAELARRGAV